MQAVEVDAQLSLVMIRVRLSVGRCSTKHNASVVVAPTRIDSVPPHAATPAGAAASVQERGVPRPPAPPLGQRTFPAGTAWVDARGSGRTRLNGDTHVSAHRSREHERYADNASAAVQGFRGGRPAAARSCAYARAAKEWSAAGAPSTLRRPDNPQEAKRVDLALTVAFVRQHT